MADLTMIRGDTMVMYLTPYRDDTPITLSDGDTFRLRVFKDDAVIISKDVTSAAQDADSLALTITLEPSDTQSIEITDKSGTTLAWEGEIEFADGTVLTPFLNRTLLIKPDKITPTVRGESTAQIAILLDAEL